MHGVTFQTKRAHLQAVAFGKRVVESIEDMTPARFDLLYAIRSAKAGFSSWTLAQKDLWKTLGLHPSTVSKMLKRLRGLNWLTNDQVDDGDGRTKLVVLTELGAQVIDEAI